MDDECEYDFLLKVLVIGDSGIGKSSVILRFSDGIFEESFVSTIGVDFKIRSLEINAKRVKVQVWDTAGQERFRTISSSYYRGAHGVLVVYDITDACSFSNVKEWLQKVEQYACSDVSIILVGNKSDLEDNRTVSTESAQEFASMMMLPLVEVSAKEGHNIELLFTQMAVKILERLTAASPPPKGKGKSNTVLLPKKKHGSNKLCLLYTAHHVKS